MSCSEVCRACLSSSLKLCNIEDLTLLDLYEKLTSFQLITEDTRPDTLCYICLWRLQRCARFSASAQRSEKYLRDLLGNNVQVTQETVATLNIVSTLSTVKLEPVTIDDDSLTEISPSFETAIKEVKIEFSDSVLPKKEIFTKKEREEILMEEVNIPTEKNMTIEKENSHYYCEKTHKEQCDEHFSTATALNGLNMSIQTGEKPYYCSNCKIGFEKTDTYRRHMDLHKNKPYACSTCQQKFHFASALKRHISKRGEAKPFACSKCDMTFKVQCGLKKHMLTHTDDKPYLCWCKKSFRYAVSLRRHMLTHTKHKCEICNVTFDKTSSLNKHKKDHKNGRPYYCEKCDLEFSMLSIFAIHMSKHSKPTVKQQSIGITQLPKSKNQSEPTKRSKPQLHTGQVACHLCDKAYKQSGQLSAHIKNLHQGVSYICDLCNSRFTVKQHLKRHIRAHAGIKPYTCVKCSRKLSTLSSLKRHMKSCNLLK